MELGLRDRVALVGGASSGLGRACARELAREGCHVVVCSRSGEAINRTADSIGDETGRRVIPVAADLSTEDGCARVVDAAREAFGRVDVLVTNTGGPPAGAFEEHDMEAWHRATALLLDSVLHLVRRVLPGMRERRWGRIIPITSIAVKQPVDGLVLSNALRAGVTGLARTLANEVASQGITVNTVMPGYTRTNRLVNLATSQAATGVQERGQDLDEVYRRWTDQVPAGRLGEPEELAALVAFLASERAAYINGQSIAVDGGWIRSLL